MMTLTLPVIMQTKGKSNFTITVIAIIATKKETLEQRNCCIKALKAHLQLTGIACRGTIVIYENPVRAEFHPIRWLRQA